MKKAPDPYRIFFPLGILNAILAVGVWYVQDLQWFTCPTIWIHSRLIAGGFLWSFITGFLMTAIPRMTGTKTANRFELSGALALILGLTGSSWITDGRFFYGLQAILVAFLLIYGGRRILKMKKSPPVFFSHVGIAMALALLGSYEHFKGNSFLGVHLYQMGATLLLVLGIGTRFFSFLSGLPSNFESDEPKVTHWLFHLAGLLVAILLYLAGSGFHLAYLGIFLLSLFYLFKVWKVQRPSAHPSALKLGVRTVALALPICFLMSWLQPAFYLAWFHVVFIGGFGILTFSVATRVTLAHGSYPIELETTSKSLRYLVIFLILGAIFRVGYGFTQGLWKESCLHTAAMFWIFAVGSWCFSFFPKFFRLKS